MLNWANRFNIFAFLDHNQYDHQSSSFLCRLAAGVKRDCSISGVDPFDTLQRFHQENPSWLFGHFNYPAVHADTTGFPTAYFFEPLHLIDLQADVMIIETEDDPSVLFQEIVATSDIFNKAIQAPVAVKARISKEAYISAIQQIQHHIQRGDCYELNFCQEFYAEDVAVDPLALFNKLNAISPNPFAVCYRWNDSYCLCASPERFIQKTANTIYSQPIKGTAKRDRQNEQNDRLIRSALLQSAKDKSENVMIVDLVRNDLSRIAQRGTVKVDELFGVYTFPQLHHMISTISAEVSDSTHWTSIIQACFPMGSMTGAPKKKVMELIDGYEISPRGLFSGTIGYVTPESDFDFNVVIRSIFINLSSRQLSFKAGGGITINSNPELEYAESLAKAEAIKKVLSGGADSQ